MAKLGRNLFRNNNNNKKMSESREKDEEFVFVYRSTSFDSSYEQILPERWQRSVSEDQGTLRTDPLDKETFESYLDTDGRLVDEHLLREAVFRGGVEKEIRSEVWKFLFGLYPFQSTRRERETMKLEYYFKYQALKERWKKVLTLLSPPGSEDEIDMHKNYMSLQTDRQNCNNVQIDETHKEVLKFQGDIYANRQPLSNSDKLMKKYIRIIDKDVPRTDRDHPLFAGDQNPNLVLLRDILITFAVFHPDVTYAQGMNDILSRFLVVLQDEVEAYWCFTLYLENVYTDFLESGMTRKLDLLRDLLTEIDLELMQHLDSLEVGDLMFCHRWLLLSFKREFKFDDAVYLFEIISSHHLELSSLEAERVCQQEIAKDFQRSAGKERNNCANMNKDFTFELFLSATILKRNRAKLLKCLDAAAVFQCVSSLTKQMEVKVLLIEGEKLLLSYCRKSVREVL
ncbi:TBC1 domain family member 15-like [Antedon mediterranea]|uniref:TBC1 domain family member 15-like n=1 Tax=Antedon mediterranea TaxID=105859 RepID=UPI003AF82E45